MKTVAIAALALLAAPSLALAAAPIAPHSIAGVAADPKLEGKVQVIMSQKRLAAGEVLEEHRQPFVRHLFVVTGQLKVSNLVTGQEQLVSAGDVAIEAAGDWHIAKAVGEGPVELFIIDQAPAEGAAVSTGGL